MKIENMAISKMFSILAALVALFSLIMTLRIFNGHTTIIPIELLEPFFFIDELNTIRNRLLEGVTFLIGSFMVACILMEVSQRYQYGSWAEYSAAKAYQDRIVKCGVLIDVNIDNDGITFKTKDCVYRCYGHAGAVSIGAELRRQRNEMIVVISGNEKRFNLVT